MTESVEPSAIALETVPLPKKLDMSSYWAANLRLIAGLLAIWFAITFLPLLLVQQLNRLEVLTGFPLGYYMGAQGSLIVFVGLIFYYARRMERLDRKYGLDQE